MNDDAVILQELQETPEGYREQIISVIDETGYEVDVAIVRRTRTVNTGVWFIRISILAIRVLPSLIPDVQAALTRAYEIAEKWAAESKVKP